MRGGLRSVGGYHSAYYGPSHVAFRKKCRDFVEEEVRPYLEAAGGKGGGGGGRAKRLGRLGRFGRLALSPA